MPAAALTQVKQLLGIENGDNDTQLKEFLELSSIEVNYQTAKSILDIAPGGVVEYRRWETPDTRLRWYESATVVLDSNYDELSPDTVDLNNGRWSFLLDQSDTRLLIRGRSYDPYGAAADFLRSVSAQDAGDLTTFSTPGGNFTFSSSEDIASAVVRFDNLRRRMAIQIVRDDLNV